VKIKKLKNHKMPFFGHYKLFFQTNAEFEAIPMSSDIDSEFGSLSPSSTKLRLEDSDTTSNTPSKPSRKNSFGKRKVRFALFREIRRIPSSIAEEAKKARLPYGYGNPIDGCMSSPFVRYVCYFAPLVGFFYLKFDKYAKI
jgi:hypothetical protein